MPITKVPFVTKGSLILHDEQSTSFFFWEKGESLQKINCLLSECIFFQKQLQGALVLAVGAEVAKQLPNSGKFITFSSIYLFIWKVSHSLCEDSW